MLLFGIFLAIKQPFKVCVFPVFMNLKVKQVDIVLRMAYGQLLNFRAICSI